VEKHQSDLLRIDLSLDRFHEKLVYGRRRDTQPVACIVIELNERQQKFVVRARGLRHNRRREEALNFLDGS